MRPLSHAALIRAAAAATVTRWRRHRGQDTPPPLLALSALTEADRVGPALAGALTPAALPANLALAALLVAGGHAPQALVTGFGGLGPAPGQPAIRAD